MELLKLGNFRISRALQLEFAPELTPLSRHSVLFEVWWDGISLVLLVRSTPLVLRVNYMGIERAMQTRRQDWDSRGDIHNFKVKRIRGIIGTYLHQRTINQWRHTGPLVNQKFLICRVTTFAKLEELPRLIWVRVDSRCTQDRYTTTKPR